MNTVRPALCSVNWGGMLRSKEGLLSRLAQNFSFSSVRSVRTICISSSFDRGDLSRDHFHKGPEHEGPNPWVLYPRR